MKYCRDCKWSREILVSERFEDMGVKIACFHEKNLEPSDGSPVFSSSTNRLGGCFASMVTGSCGKSGRFWEKKE
jgi:hypothetical protein